MYPLPGQGPLPEPGADPGAVPDCPPGDDPVGGNVGHGNCTGHGIGTEVVTVSVAVYPELQFVSVTVRH